MLAMILLGSPLVLCAEDPATHNAECARSRAQKWIKCLIVENMAANNPDTRLVIRDRGNKVHCLLNLFMHMK